MNPTGSTPVPGVTFRAPAPCSPSSIPAAEIVSEISLIAGEAVAQTLQRISQGTLNPRRKEDGSWLTDADMASHRLLSERLPRVLDVPVLSEEGYPPFAARSELQTFWLIDPIDNTQGLVTNSASNSSVSIALIVEGAPRLAVVAYLDGERLLQVHGDLVALHSRPGELRYLTSSEATHPLRFVAYRSTFNDMADLTRTILNRLDVSENHLVAGQRLYQRFWRLLNGEADVYLEPRPLPGWDVAPHLCACLAQGGTAISLLTGNQLNYNSPSMKVDPFIVGRRGVDTFEIQRRVKAHVPPYTGS